MADDLIPSIETNAAAPKMATIDGNTAQQHSLPDQIGADKYIKSAKALAASPLGFRHVRLRPPGAHGVDVGCP